MLSFKRKRDLTQLKRCTICGTKKVLTEFLSANRQRLYPQCEPCRQEYNRKQRQEHDTRIHEVPLTAKCMICGRKFGVNLVPHYDHCHRTGQHRGWLCRACNHMLGNANDSIERLLNAIEYLKRFQQAVNKKARQVTHFKVVASAPK